MFSDQISILENLIQDLHRIRVKPTCGVQKKGRLIERSNEPAIAYDQRMQA